MEARTGTERNGGPETAAAKAIWLAIIAALSVAASLIFACAAPLAAIAALAATQMRQGYGLGLVLTAWLANQVVGYTVLDYPVTSESFAWGAVMGAAAVAGFVAARRLVSSRIPELAALALAFGLAFVTYEAVLLAASAALPASDDVFSLSVVWRMLAIDAGAFAGLTLLHKAARLAPVRSRPEIATA